MEFKAIPYCEACGKLFDKYLEVTHGQNRTWSHLTETMEVKEDEEDFDDDEYDLLCGHCQSYPGDECVDFFLDVMQNDSETDKSKAS